MDKTYLGRRLANFSPGIASQPISKVELLDENGDVVGVSGSDTGRTLTALQPDGTNAMAAAILAKVSGYKHIGYEGRKALLDPAAELGDAVTVDGLYVPLIALDMTFDPLLAPDISAPDADEIDDEYPYKSPTQRQIERNMAKTRSLIAKTSEEIMLKVEGIDGRVTSLSTSIDGIEAEVKGLDGAIANIKVDVNSIRATVSGKIDGNTAQSMIDQSIDKIELSVSSGSDGSTFTLKAGSTELSTNTLNLHVNAVNIDGTLKASQIQAGGIYVGDLADGSDYATKTYVDNNAGLSQTEVDDRIDTYIDSTSITAEILRGRTVSLMANRRTEIGTIELVDTSTGYGISISTYDGGIQLDSGGNVYITSAYRTRLQLDDDAAKIGPTVWATDGTVIYSSDKNVKNSIDYDLSRYRQFLLDLKPCRFKYNEGQSGRYHIGMIAQDMEQSLADNGIAASEFSGWCKMPMRDENHNITGYTYGIRYDSLIPLNTLMIQELVKRVEALEKRS
jgi:hypothetical protein|nr:MAG TPA: endosialidase chaperone [Caudoviricetes sp.]